MSQAPAGAPTYQDVLDAPPYVTTEIVDGVLFMTPRPSSRHVLAASAMGVALGGPFGRVGPTVLGPGGWWIVAEPELHLDRDILVPDLAGWRRQRMPVFPDVPFFSQTPDWICDVLSPSTAGLDRVRKMAIWAREGVGHAWLADPTARTLEVYRLTSGLMAWVQGFEGDAVVRAEPFDAVEVDLGLWWLPG